MSKFENFEFQGIFEIICLYSSSHYLQIKCVAFRNTKKQLKAAKLVFDLGVVLGFRETP